MAFSACRDSSRCAARHAADYLPAATRRGHSALHNLALQFHLFRPRTGDKTKTLGEIVELTTRAAHEQELFSSSDWEFIQWLSESHSDPEGLWIRLF